MGHKRQIYCLSGVGQSRKMCHGKSSSVVGPHPPSKSRQLSVGDTDRRNLSISSLSIPICSSSIKEQTLYTKFKTPSADQPIATGWSSPQSMKSSRDEWS